MAVAVAVALAVAVCVSGCVRRPLCLACPPQALEAEAERLRDTTELNTQRAAVAAAGQQQAEVKVAALQAEADAAREQMVGLKVEVKRLAEELRLANISVTQLTQDMRESSVAERAAKDRALTMEEALDAANRRHELEREEVTQVRA